MKSSYLCKVFILIVWALLATQPAFAFDTPWDLFGHFTATNDEPEEPGPPDPPCGASNTTSSPVYTAKGHFVWRESDVTLAGRPSVSVNRTYNSHDPRDGIFGNGWSSNCEPILNKVTDPDDQVSYVYVAADGKRYTYAQNNDGSFQTPEGRYDTLTVADTESTLTAQSGSFQKFNLTGQITQWSDPNGVSRLHEYDANGQLAKITGGGNSAAFTYDTNGHVSNVQDHTGRSWTYNYDGNGNLVSIIDPLGGVRTFTYQAYTDSADGHTYYQLVQVTDSSGKTVIAVTYNNNKVRSYTEMGNTYRYSYNTNTKTVTKTDSSGRRYSFVYNDEQIITQKTDPLGNTVKFEYDSNGNTTKFTDPLNNEWSSTFDTDGRRLTVVTPLGYIQQWSYTGTNPKPTQITTPEGNTTVITHDGKLNPTAITDAKGNTVNLIYDDKGNITNVTDAKGKQSVLAYNVLGLPTAITDANGNTTSFTYDVLGRRTASTDAEGRTINFEYDDLNRLVKTTNALGHVTQYVYDEMGRMLSLTDPVGNITRFEYDQFGRKFKEIRPDGKETSYTYDTANLLTQVDRYDGKRITLGYDNTKRLTSAAVGSDTITYSYDSRGDRVTVANTTSTINYTYDDDGNLVQEDQNGITFDRAYNKDGALTQLKYLDQTLDYTRDALNSLSKLTSGSDGFDFIYDANNVLASVGLPNGLSEIYSYDDIYNLIKITTGNTTLDYTHDKTGLITSKTRDGDRVDYNYDPIARLTQAGVESFNYDAAGNELGNSSQYEPETNRLSENADYIFTYDAGGNLTQKQRKDGTKTKDYTFNDRNQLLEVTTMNGAGVVTKTLEFSYDPLGRRYGKLVDGVLQRYVYDGVDIIAILDASSNTISDIVHSASIDAPLSIKRGVNTYYYHRNHQGSIISLTDASGNIAESNVYNGYGLMSKKLTATTGNIYSFTGREIDDDDLYYYRARYYDPTLKRFLSEDPIYLLSGDINYYNYVLNSPINMIDPSGFRGVYIPPANRSPYPIRRPPGGRRPYNPFPVRSERADFYESLANFLDETMAYRKKMDDLSKAADTLSRMRKAESEIDRRKYYNEKWRDYKSRNNVCSLDGVEDNAEINSKFPYGPYPEMLCAPNSPCIPPGDMYPGLLFELDR